MKRKAAGLAAFVAVALAGIAVSMVGGVTSAASAHVGNATFDCAKGVQFSFTGFPNANGNSVHVTASANEAKIDTILTWNGSTFTSPWLSFGATNGKTTFEATGDWNSNGVSGSFDTGAVILDCSKPCNPVTVTITQTVTVPSVTTASGQTVTATVTTASTTTAPAVTTTKTVTKTVIKYRTKWRTRTVVKWRTKIVRKCPPCPPGLVGTPPHCGAKAKG